jgi:hypothetical protein
VVTRKLLNSGLEHIYFEVIHTNPGKPIGFEIWVDQQCLLDYNKLCTNLEFYHQFTKQQQSHQLKLVIKNKTPWHTVLNSDNQIVADTGLQIQNFKLNDILMIDSFFVHAKYHTKNKNITQLIDCFGYLGFNGEVIFDFESPVDEWSVRNYL